MKSLLTLFALTLTTQAHAAGQESYGGGLGQGIRWSVSCDILRGPDGGISYGAPHVRVVSGFSEVKMVTQAIYPNAQPVATPMELVKKSDDSTEFEYQTADGGARFTVTFRDTGSRWEIVKSQITVAGDLSAPCKQEQ